MNDRCSNTAEEIKRGFDELLADIKAQIQEQSPEILANRLINRAELRKVFPVSNMTIWRLENQGRFPNHMNINGRNFWNFLEVLEARARLAEESADD